MAIEIPFELDTIDAILEAQDQTELLIAILSRVAPFVIYLLCAVFEYIAFSLVDSKMLEVSCVQYYEISEAAAIYLILTYIPILPDMMFTILGPISILMLYNNPYGVFYNGATGLLCIVSGAYFHANLTFCGNPAQNTFVFGPILLYLSGILHIGNAVLNHASFMFLDKQGELYFGQVQDFIDDMRDE